MENKLNFIHVDDLINAFLKIIKSKIVNKFIIWDGVKKYQLIKLLIYLGVEKFLYQRDLASLRGL